MIFEKNSVIEMSSRAFGPGFSDKVDQVPKTEQLSNYLTISFNGEHKIFPTDEYLSLIGLWERGLLFKHQLELNSPC